MASTDDDGIELVDTDDLEAGASQQSINENATKSPLRRFLSEARRRAKLRLGQSRWKYCRCIARVIIPLYGFFSDFMRVTSLFNLVRYEFFFLGFGWNKHVLYAKRDNPEAILDYYESRYSTILAVAALLLASMLGVLFSTADAPTTVAECLKGTNDSGICIVASAAGFFNILSVFLSLCTIFSTSLTWGTIKAVAKRNIVFFLSIRHGILNLQLPVFMFYSSIGSSFVTIILYLFIMMDWRWALASTVFAVYFSLSIQRASARFAYLITHSGAMMQGSDDAPHPSVFYQDDTFQEVRWNILEWEKSIRKKVDLMIGKDMSVIYGAESPPSRDNSDHND